MATPKERHDARDRAREADEPTAARGSVEGALPRSLAAPVGAEEQADGQPENELELHDHSGATDGAGSRGKRRRGADGG